MQRKTESNYMRALGFVDTMLAELGVARGDIGQLTRVYAPQLENLLDAAFRDGFDLGVELERNQSEE